MNATPLVSIIMPAYNADRFIAAAVRSVLEQTWSHWELIVVNDGSTDRTVEVVEGLKDPRIKLLHQTNHGIGHARNSGLDVMRGEFICFLDADDILPANSLEARVRRMQERPEVDFCDGRVVLMDQRLEHELRRYAPTFRGHPFHELVRLSGTCFFGITWMVRWSAANRVRFNTTVSHAEDLLFYLTLPVSGIYDHVDEVVLTCRRTAGSSMSDLQGLERSYHYIKQWLQARPSLTTPYERLRFAWRIRRIMAGSYRAVGSYGLALRALLFEPPGVPAQRASNTAV